MIFSDRKITDAQIERRSKQLFRVIDKDKGGEIELEEFILGYSTILAELKNSK